MSGVARSRIAVLALCLMGLACGGCATGQPWRWPWDKTPVSQRTDIVAPAETMAKIRKLGDDSASAGPPAQEQASQQLSEMIRKEADPVIRSEIIRALGKLTAATAKETVLTASKDPDTDVRISACEALGRQGGPQAVAALGDTLKVDLEPEVRMNAAKALGQTHDPAAVAALGGALADEDPAMQLRAVQSLRQVSGKDFGNDVARWRQYVHGETPAELTVAERMRRLF